MLEIEEYAFGTITISGATYHKDVLVFPDRVEYPWVRKEGHSLAPEDLETVAVSSPKLLIIGLGHNGAMRIPAQTGKWLEEKGIELKAADTGKAVKLYNELKDKSKAVAGFHLTC